MFKVSSFGANTRLKTLHHSSIALLMSLCLPSVKKSDVLIMIGFRVWSDLCSDLNFGLIW